MQEEMNQRASTTNPPTPSAVETPTPVPQVDPPININAPDGVANDNPRPHVFETDDQHNAFFSPRDASQDDAFGSATNEVERKVKAIEENLWAMGSTDVLSLDAEEMCLVPGVIIPAKFKVPNFEKYKGNSDPMTHIRAYCQKMLQNLTQRSEESFKEYAQRWRELASRVQPSLLERELVDMFIGNLQDPYLDRMVGSTSSGFSDLVLAGERIENMIKMGKIQNSASTSVHRRNLLFPTVKNEKARPMPPPSFKQEIPVIHK
ncbi:uncharacterized protein LOC127103178 [Lathyrus oleraceus]|uniref:uncharacterized protein LOC127103178 n=1 Tax=Pisum sativum TaxID=3888 RepID=UPI0021D2E054|nr:uncharacterized protein LOC127103178 [Pisum sativum]